MKLKMSALGFFVMFCALSAAASDYPQSDLEKQIEQDGSLLKGEGITFRPGRLSNILKLKTK